MLDFATVLVTPLICVAIMQLPIFISIISISVIFNVIIQCDSAKVLGVFPFESRTHHLMFDGIIMSLLRKGHQVDVVTLYPFKESVPNYRVVVNLEGKRPGFINKWNITYASKLGLDTLPSVAEPYGNGLCEYLGLPEMQELMKNTRGDPPYDVIIMEALGFNCFIGLGHVLNAPVVLASTMIIPPWLAEGMGQPLFPAFVSAYFTFNAHPMSFLKRVQNTISTHVTNLRYRYYTETVQNAQMQKYIDPNIPPLRELEKNVSLALVNTWHSLNGVQPLTPGLVEIGGIHVQDHYIPMPQEMEKWMNDSTAGVVYFTLGSMVNIETFPEVTMKALYSVFRSIAPVRVLMKVANESALLPGLPANVRTSSWISQVAVLAHRNTKVFITHGGLMSTQEALTYGVPLIGIPLFGDQTNNVAMYESLGIALKLDLDNLTEETISWALKEMLFNPKYREMALYQSRKFLDRPMTAADTAVYWVEYAIKHGPGALKSPVADFSWWQIDLLDVYIFLIICSLAALYTFLRIIKIILKKIGLMRLSTRLKVD